MRNANTCLLAIAAWACIAHAEPLTNAGLLPAGFAAVGPGQLTGTGDSLFFVLGGEGGDELWRLRGTSTRPVRVSGFKPPDSSDAKRYVHRLWETAGLLFAQVAVDLSPRFSSVELWVSDGTGGGTRQLLWVTLEGPGELTRGGVAMPEPVQLEYDALGAGNTFLITARKTAQELDSTAVHLWTRGGRKVQPVLGAESSFALVGARAGRVYFRRAGEIWAAEGGRLTKILEDAYRSWPDEATGVTFRGARYEAGYDEQHGRELWRTNGTASGTELLADLVPGPDDGSPRLLTRVRDQVVFVAGAEELWVTDGTRAGTVQIAPTISSSVRYQPKQVRLRGRLIFSGGHDDPAHGQELWSGDGSPGGSSLLKDIRPGPEPSNLYALTPAGDVVYFVAEDGVHGYGLWRTDGTAEGTVPVMESIPGTGPNSEVEVTAVGPLLFFAVHQTIERTGARVFRSELWRTGGGGSGATLVKRWEHLVSVQSNDGLEGPLRIDMRENLRPLLPSVPTPPGGAQRP